MLSLVVDLRHVVTSSATLKNGENYSMIYEQYFFIPHKDEFYYNFNLITRIQYYVSRWNIVSRVLNICIINGVIPARVPGW